MAKIKGLDKVRASTIRKINGALASAPELKEINEIAKKEFRSGRLLDGSKIKPLAKSTVQRRRKLARVNRTGKGFQPGKSNLTLTGQFIESLKTVVNRKNREIKILIAPTGVNRGVFLLKGGRAKGVQNTRLAQFLANGGRDISRVGNEFSGKVTKIVRKILRRAFR